MITITSSNKPVVYQTNNYSQPMVSGAVQWNGATQRLEVSTGSSWMPLNTTVNISTNQEVLNVLDWAQKKMFEEKELEELANTSPAINDLVNQIKEKKDQIKMIQTLIKNNDESAEMQAI